MASFYMNGFFFGYLFDLSSLELFFWSRGNSVNAEKRARQG
jgi:hypothetical protein